MNPKPEIRELAELPLVPVTIGDMSFNRTGLWRYLEPVIKDRTAPCQAACPLGMPSPEFITRLVRNDPAGALGLVLEYNPLPGLTGRLCFHPCRGKCLRRKLDRPVRLDLLEAHLADTVQAPEQTPPQPAEGLVAVLGSGPVGLSAGYFLGLAGVETVVYDPRERAGGFLNEVDEKKLPGHVLEREVARLVTRSGLKMKLGTDADSTATDLKDRGFSLIIHDKGAHAAGTVASRRSVPRGRKPLPGHPGPRHLRVLSGQGLHAQPDRHGPGRGKGSGLFGPGGAGPDQGG